MIAPLAQTLAFQASCESCELSWRSSPIEWSREPSERAHRLVRAFVLRIAARRMSLARTTCPLREFAIQPRPACRWSRAEGSEIIDALGASQPER